MRKDSTPAATDNEPIHIGKIIEQELRRQERSVTWLSRKLHCDRRNVYDIFTREYIDTGLLYRICIALNTDFFAYFSQSLHSIDNQEYTPPQNHFDDQPEERILLHTTV